MNKNQLLLSVFCLFLPIFCAYSQNNPYNWLNNYDASAALSAQIAVPKGYERQKTAANSWQHFLQNLPLLATGTKVMLYNGSEKPYQAGAMRVVNLDIGDKDLQQCADAIMRLKAEYHYAKREYAAIYFNYTSGDRVAFDDWRKGRKPKVGKTVTFSPANGREDNSRNNFEKYLINVFSYAGTASLEQELQKISLSELQIGDIFIKGGFPGHAIIVLDVAKNIATGQKIFLLAQSYMPAQSLHVLTNPNANAVEKCWYQLKEGEELRTPEWTFAAQSLKRFKN